ncbi:PHP domain-containing protein [Solibacillus sp. FSL H8-0523]|uniref:PHP domain-containing protein n=1 Tax=Solibacillus sp. FSL H8-0523 TaxID=2954511 RepID=UPI0031012DCB
MCKNDEVSMIELHNHLDTSNFRLLDCTISVEELIQTAADMGKKAVAITDHETVAAHVKGIQTTRRLKESGKIPEDFKLILGNEIYLVNSLEEVRDNYQSGITKFPHFLLLAKNKEGHEALRKLSSMAWENSFYTGTMERVPTIKSNLVDIIKEYPNTLIGTSACLGSESSIHILNGDYEKAKAFLQWCSQVFGEGNFYLEMQPAKDGEQRIVNEKLIEFSNELNLELIITSDTHYLRPEDADIHAAYLNAKDGDRETAMFYSNTYLHTKEEIYEKLSYIDEAIVTRALLNTLEIGDMIEDYTIEAPTIIPKIELPAFELKHLFEPGYQQYSYIKKMAYSEDEQDRYLVHLIEEGFLSLIPYKVISKVKFHNIIERINVELGELWEISLQLQQAMSAYYVTIQEIVNIMWGDDCGEDSRTEGSLVGSGRGSASGFLINYLLGITQINALEYGIEMPHWRHLHRSRGDISALDIDLDVEPEKRQVIIKRMREKFGERRVLEVCTYGTEGSKSAIQTACRGLGIDLDIGQYLSSLIPFERGENYSISDCLYGNAEKERKASREFIREIEKHPRLKETALKIEGLINKRSIHAGGVILTNEDYTKTNAMMRAPNQRKITQYNLDDTQALGSIKYDVLGVSNMSKLHQSLDIMLDKNLVQWQGTLRKTFNEYLRPEKMDLNDPKRYELLGQGKIPDLFQFDTKLAAQALMDTKPTNLIEMAAVNSLMRLMANDGESPVSTFTKYKKDINLWYEEMKNYNLNNDEIKIMEKHLLPLNGVADTQEVVMLLVMDEKIAAMDMTAANKLRKAIAKKSEKAYEAVRKDFYIAGEQIGTRKEFLDYVWNVQIARQKGYGFSILHTIAYSIIGLQNIEIVYKYGPIIWYTACLTINSGSTEVEEGEKGKSTDYGKVAAAIGNLKSYGVTIELPFINSASFGFTPDLENDKIYYSLKGINGIGDNIVHEIIKNRPYASFEDFYERMYKTKLIQRSHFLQLIKAGAFNEMGAPIEIMKQFLISEVNAKETLDGKNLSKIISLGLFHTPKLKQYEEYYNFRKYIMKSTHKSKDYSDEKIYLLDNYSQYYFENNFTFDSVVGEYKGNLLISEKKFKKEYDQKMLPIKPLYTDAHFIRKFNQAQFLEIWNETAAGTVSKWEMDSVSYYSNEHELGNVDYERYGFSNFFALDEAPVVLEEYEWRGREMKRYQLFTIIGTVLDKNKNNHTITVLTPEGVVTVKTYGGNFSYYDKRISKNESSKKTILENSWFTRGNLLMLTGYRREDQFVLKALKGEHTINLITKIGEDGSLSLQAERTRV